jgi:acyl-CoA hydrolase
VRRIRSPNQLADAVAPGQSIFIPGATGIPLAFIDALLMTPEISRDVRLMTSIAPGIENPLDGERLHPTAVVSGLFMQPSLAQAQRSGRYRMLPLSYSGFVRYLRDTAAFDLTVVQVSPPDHLGRCSLGPSVEFTPLAVAKSRRVLALLNPNVPRLPGAATLPIDHFDDVCEVDTPLSLYEVSPHATTDSIAKHIASQIPDGATLQMGLGTVPASLASQLRAHRGLKLHSGLLSDGLMVLAEGGALDADFMNTGCVLAGSARLYEWAADFAGLRVTGCEVTHDARVLAAFDHFIAVNSALEVDLFGQCNLEHADGRCVSGAGGAPDFARAAMLSTHGRSIVALNATYRKGRSSRIVPALGEGAITSLSRADVNCIVTEHGVADLRGLSVHERASAIMRVAAAEFRESLQRTWGAMASRL